MQFEGVFPDEQIVYALRRQLSWTHIKTLMFIPEPLKRDFYIEMCKLERWSSRQLQEREQRRENIEAQNRPLRDFFLIYVSESDKTYPLK